jgi:hypothetical protein
MRKSVGTSVLLILVALFWSAPAGAQAGRGCGGNRGGQALQIVGLTQDQRLICFSEADPQGAVNLGTVSGLAADQRLVGIDFRPATGELFGLGDAGGLYVLDLRDGGATFRSQLSVGLTGAAFGIDFNPTVDRLRIVSDGGQNLRVNVDTGMATVDGALNPSPGTGITAVAYTNNDANPNTGTTLYALDTQLDQLAIQAPPNNGTLNATGKMTVDGGAQTGFDIFSALKGRVAVGASAFASMIGGGRASLYSINLFTGKATHLGTFRRGDQVVDIAIPPR